jgi:serine/threonine-protein kinase
VESKAQSDLLRATPEPRILDRYAIYGEIASGGMATVHYGRLLGSVGFSRTVAIKRLHPQYAKDPDFVAMFLDEARLAGRIRHPNVVQTLDIVASGDELFLVMDYVHGESLSRVTRMAERVPLSIALRIASDSLQGLHAAHEARDEQGKPLHIVHRDVSPHNILLGIDGVARLVDFGVAKATGRSHTTREGQLKGKLGYMAPEQLMGASATVTRQCDVHAFAVVFWEMLTGRRLFLGDTEADTVGLVVRHNVPPVSATVPGIPPALDAVIARGLAPEVENRYATAREMCQALDECGVMSTTMTVADWVQHTVGDSLAQRARIIQAIEADRKPSVPDVLEVGGPQRDSAIVEKARVNEAASAAGVRDQPGADDRYKPEPSESGLRPTGASPAAAEGGRAGPPRESAALDPQDRIETLSPPPIAGLRPWTVPQYAMVGAGLLVVALLGLYLARRDPSPPAPATATAIAIASPSPSTAPPSEIPSIPIASATAPPALAASAPAPSASAPAPSATVAAVPSAAVDEPAKPRKHGARPASSASKARPVDNVFESRE